MEPDKWAWVCTCGTVIPGTPKDRDALLAVSAHAEQHRHALEKIFAHGSTLDPIPTAIIPLKDFPPPYAFRIPLTNLTTGEEAPHFNFGVANPDYEALRQNGGTPYRIEALYKPGPLSSVALLDRAIRDVDVAVTLIGECHPPLGEGISPDFFRERLLQAVNLLCSAHRDLSILKDQLFITHAAYDQECLRQRHYCAFEPEPMFYLTGEDQRGFTGGGHAFSGPLTIQEHLTRYASALYESAQHAALALLVDESDMRQDPPGNLSTAYQMHLFGAMAFTYEEESDDLHKVRVLIASDDVP